MAEDGEVMAGLAKMEDIPMPPWMTAVVWLVIAAGIVLAVVTWKKRR